MTKLKDIAHATGFSIATISRVLNHDQAFSVSEETRLTILSAAEKLNYRGLGWRHQLLDNGITEEKSHLNIGLAYWHSVANEINDPYYLSIRLAIQEYCDLHHIELKLFYLLENKHEQIKAANLDGLIALGKYSPAEIEQLHALSPHFILVDSYSRHPEIDVVNVDLEGATKDVIEYLNKAGISQIGFIGGLEATLDDKVTMNDIRLKTFLRYEKVNHDTIYQGEFTADAGYQIMSNIIHNSTLQPAYIVASDTIAIGCLRALNEHKIKIPNQVSIISFNNISLSQYTTPTLTTVDLNTYHIGTTAVETLCERIKTKRRLSKKIFISTELIKRESSL